MSAHPGDAFVHNNGVLTKPGAAGSGNMVSPDSPRSSSIHASLTSASDSRHGSMTCAGDCRISSSRHVSISSESDPQYSAVSGRNDPKNNRKDRRLHKALTTGCITKGLKQGLLQQPCSLQRMPSPHGSLSARTLSSRFPKMSLDGGGMSLSRVTCMGSDSGVPSSRFTNVGSDGGGMSSARGANTNSGTACTEPYSESDRDAGRASSLGRGENVRFSDREVDQAYVVRKNIQLHREVDCLRAKIVHLMGKNEKLEHDMAHLKKSARESKIKHHDAYSLLQCSPTPRKRAPSSSGAEMNHDTEQCNGACPAPPSPRKSSPSAKSMSLSPRRARSQVAVTKTEQRAEEKQKQAGEKLQQRCAVAEAEAQFWREQNETMRAVLEEAKGNKAKHAQDESELSLLKAERAMMKYKTERSQRFALEKNKQLRLKTMALAAAEGQIADGVIGLRGFEKMRRVDEHAGESYSTEALEYSEDQATIDHVIAHHIARQNAGKAKSELSEKSTQNSSTRINMSDSKYHLVDDTSNLSRGELMSTPSLVAASLAWKPNVTIANSHIHESSASLLNPSSSQISMVRAPSSAQSEAIAPPSSAMTVMNAGTPGTMLRPGLMWGVESRAPGAGNGGWRVGVREDGGGGRLSPHGGFGLRTPGLLAYSLSGRMSAPSPMMPSMFSQPSFLSPRSAFQTQQKT
eukprot:GEMP01008585.1.p1 GENE.GEMP01008585.1~~GEMP01008585.1.p1  ORF type:complete len:687 (+),score=164.43 GEMP01008585.1:511-2571(+)